MPETLNTDTIGGPSQLKQGFGVYFGTDIYIYIYKVYKRISSRTESIPMHSDKKQKASAMCKIKDMFLSRREYTCRDIHHVHMSTSRLYAES